MIKINLIPSTNKAGQFLPTTLCQEGNIISLSRLYQNQTAVIRIPSTRFSMFQDCKVFVIFMIIALRYDALFFTNDSIEYLD